MSRPRRIETPPPTRHATRPVMSHASYTLHTRAEVRALVSQSLDLELRARAMELAALDKALKELKSALQLEIKTQQERLQERLEEVLAMPEPDKPETPAKPQAG